MRMAVLAHSLRVAGGRSVGQSLTSALVETAPQHEYLWVVPAGAGYELPDSRHGDRLVEVPALSLPKRLVFEMAQLPRLVKAFRPDWVWGLNNVGLSNPPCRQAVLFQDSHLVYPQRHFALETRWYKFRKGLVKRRLRASLPKTDVVFCQTRTAKRRFVEEFGFTGEVALCPNAVSPLSTRRGSGRTPPLLEPYAGRFKMLCLAKYCAHKNFEGIVETYARHRESLAETVVALTIAPDQHPLAGAVIDRIRREGLEDLLLPVGAIPQQELADWFGQVNAVLFPTLLESFSGTYLEAMHFGVPILTSDLDFAHDVCDDAALYFDPWNPEAMEQAILALAADPGRQAKLVQAGKERLASMFRSWNDVVREALDVMGVDHQ